MSQRDRPAPGGSAPASPRPADSPAPGPTWTWESFYPVLTPTEQRSLLTLAQTQGFLTVGQLPMVSGSGSSQDHRHDLSQLLTSDGWPRLRAIEPEEFTPKDGGLDAFQ